LERAGIVLLPFLLLVPQDGPTEEVACATRGPHVSRAFHYRQPALRGGARPVVLRGALVDEPDAPCLVIAMRSEAAAGGYDPLAHHVASHGCAALGVVRTLRDGATGDATSESWWRYADAVDGALWQLRAEAETPESPLHHRIDLARTVLLAEGDGALSIGPAVAKNGALRGLILIDPPAPGPALGWIASVRAPLLVVATEAPGRAPAEAWFNAAASEQGQRWLVELSTERSIGDAPPDDDGVLQRDVRALVTAFVDVHLNPDGRVPPSFAELAAHGTIDRTVRGGAASLPVVRPDAAGGR
jgi:hypothetical protein